MRTEAFQIGNFIDGKFVEPGQLLVMSSEVETSLAIPFVSVVLIERQAFGAYNAKQCARNQSKSKTGFESLPHRACFLSKPR